LWGEFYSNYLCAAKADIKMVHTVSPRRMSIHGPPYPAQIRPLNLAIPQKFDAEQRNARSFNGVTSGHPTDFQNMSMNTSTIPCLSLLESIIPIEIMEIIVGNLDFRSLPKLLATSRRMQVSLSRPPRNC